MSTKPPVENNGAQFAMISLAALQNSKLAGEFICEIDSSNCTETITYFQQAQNFTSSFACFTQSLQAQGSTSVPADTGGEVVFNISRVGDVLLGLTAVITLPELISIGEPLDNGDGDGYHSIGWVGNIGHHLINKCELLAQDTVVESFGTGGQGSGVYGAFMDCHMGMTNQSGKNTLYSTMIGNRPHLTDVYQRRPVVGAPASINSRNLYCPLQLSFCAKNDSGVPAAPLPVCALAYCTLQVKLGFNRILSVVHATPDSVELGDGAAGAGENGVANLCQASDEWFTTHVGGHGGSGGKGVYAVSMLAEYAMVSSQERAALACAKTTQHVLHRQSFSKSSSVSNASASDVNQITFSGCNAYWWSLWQNTGIGSAASVEKLSSPGSVLSSNYTSGYNCVQNSQVVPIEYETGNGHSKQLGQNPVSSIKVNADSSPILDITDEMTQWYNWWWKTANNGCYDQPADVVGVKTGMNLIPFCLTTEFYAIEANGGFLNLSKLTNVTEQTTFKSPASGQPYTYAQAAQFTVNTSVHGSLDTFLKHTNWINTDTSTSPYPIKVGEGEANFGDGSNPGVIQIPQNYNHYVLSVSYNSVVVSGGTLQHPYY